MEVKPSTPTPPKILVPVAQVQSASITAQESAPKPIEAQNQLNFSPMPPSKSSINTERHIPRDHLKKHEKKTPLGHQAQKDLSLKAPEKQPAAPAPQAQSQSQSQGQQGLDVVGLIVNPKDENTGKETNITGTVVKGPITIKSSKSGEAKVESPDTSIDPLSYAIIAILILIIVVCLIFIARNTYLVMMKRDNPTYRESSLQPRSTLMSSVQSPGQTGSEAPGFSSNREYGSTNRESYGRSDYSNNSSGRTRSGSSSVGESASGEADYDEISNSVDQQLRDIKQSLLDVYDSLTETEQTEGT